MSSPAESGAKPRPKTNVLHSKSARKPPVVIVLNILNTTFYSRTIKNQNLALANMAIVRMTTRWLHSIRLMMVVLPVPWLIHVQVWSQYRPVKLRPYRRSGRTDYHYSYEGHYIKGVWWRNLEGRQFGWDGDGWVRLGRAPTRHPQTWWVFAILSGHLQVRVDTSRIGTISELGGRFAVAASAVWPVLGLHELIAERPMASWCGLNNALPSLRYPKWIHHVVRGNAAYYLQQVSKQAKRMTIAFKSH